MYDVTTRFFPQFLTFKMADEVTREDVPSNRMLVDEIRTYRAICDKSCHEDKDQKVKKNAWQALVNTLKIDVASAQQKIQQHLHKHLQVYKEKSGFGRDDLVIRPDYK